MNAAFVLACACSAGSWATPAPSPTPLPPAASRSVVLSAISSAARDVGLPRNFVLAIAENESDLISNSVSKAGAIGVMQMLPAVALEYGAPDPFDAVANVYAGTKMLARYRSHYGGNLTLTIAAYNAGCGTVDRFHGVPPWPETKTYVASVLATMKRLNAE